MIMANLKMAAILKNDGHFESENIKSGFHGGKPRNY